MLDRAQFKRKAIPDRGTSRQEGPTLFLKLVVMLVVDQNLEVVNLWDTNTSPHRTFVY